jgi:pimeloyl-ACP methyl ester carboxylesterase
MAPILDCDVAGDGPAILFVHGFPLDRWMWHHQVATLTGYRRIAPDLPGLGGSPPLTGPPTVGTYASALARQLDDFGVDSVVLCGLSMGGYIAFECLRQWPERIVGLALMDTRADADTPEGKQGRDRLIAEVRARGAVAAADAMMPRLVGSTTAALRPGWLAELRTRIERTPVEGIVGGLEAIKSRPDSRSLLPAIAVPTLVLVGAEDVVTPPAMAEELAAQIPGSRLVVVPDAGHLPTLEQPAAVTEVLRDFLRRVV